MTRTDPMPPEDGGEPLTLIVDPSAAGERADKALSLLTDLTRSAAARLLEDGAVTMDGRTIAKKTLLTAGSVLTVVLPPPQPCEAQPEDIPLDIVYEDGDLIVVNKPKGMVVHPAPGHMTGTLVSALLYHCGQSLSGIGGVLRPGIVHRIDRDTTGLIAAAKNDAAHLALAAQLADHSMHREYLAVVQGGIAEKGTVDLPIARSPKDRKKMAVFPKGTPGTREAVTHYEPLERYAGYTLLRLVLETGRTHQIRVHMAAIGHPVLGDEVYGGASTDFAKRNAALLQGQCLHAETLILRHPRTGEMLRLTADPPEGFRAILGKLR